MSPGRHWRCIGGTCRLIDLGPGLAIRSGQPIDRSRLAGCGIAEPGDAIFHVRYGLTSPAFPATPMRESSTPAGPVASRREPVGGFPGMALRP